MNEHLHKLSASALNTFLRSPRAFYYSYILRLEPLQPSVATFDHDKICGIVWAEFVERFYKGISEDANTSRVLEDWFERTDGWVPTKARDKLTDALRAWASQYYQMFSPDDGCRDKSELFLENDRFVAYLDGLSKDGIVHEVKTAGRSPQLAGQLWKVEHSIQVRLYSVLADAKGYCIEFSWKDPPYQIFRGPITLVTDEQKLRWETELNALADSIYALGTDPNHFPCNPDSCCLTTRGVTSMCPYQILCEDGLNETNSIAFKKKTRR